MLWSKQYDQKLDDVFDIQAEIALRIIENLKIELLGGERDRLLKRHTENMQAFSHYTNGLFWWNKRTGDGLKRAIDYFDMAVA